jgi:hypothetical protein
VSDTIRVESREKYSTEIDHFFVQFSVEISQTKSLLNVWHYQLISSNLQSLENKINKHGNKASKSRLDKLG